MRDYGVVGISSKVEQESESENPDTLVFGGELFEAWSKRLKFSSLGVPDVQVGGQVVAFEIGDGVVQFILRRVPLIELMVAGTDDVNGLLLEYVKDVFSLGLRSIVEAIAFYSVPSVDNDQVDTFVVSTVFQMLSKRDVVAPVCGV